MPKNGDKLTPEQVGQIKNLSKYTDDPSSVEIVRNWHQGSDGGGLFEPWSMKHGYQDGYPLYADIKIKGTTYHVYWLPQKGEMQILRPGEDPE